jgi:hypothetical protein
MHGTGMQVLASHYFRVFKEEEFFEWNDHAHLWRVGVCAVY